MLQFFRKIIGSKFGAFFAIVLLGLIALSFAGGDIAHWRSGGGSGTAVANVGDRAIEPAALTQAANTAVERQREQQPTASMPGFIAAGGLERVLGSLIDRAAIAAWGDRHDVVASDRLIDSEIAKLPAFQGPDGRFSQTIFNQLMQQRGIDEKAVRAEIGESLIARGQLVPASFGATMPQTLAAQYAGLLREKREGSIAVLPAQLFAPAAAPDDATLTAWYQANRNRFIRPERRVIRYAVLTDAGVKTVAPPTEAEIAARYSKDAAKYAAVETRSITQLILANEADARASLAEAKAGKPLAAVAQARGLGTLAKAGLTRAALAAQTSPALADAAFAAPTGTIIGPVRGGIGWSIAKVDAVAGTPARTLEQVRGEITAQLTADKRRQALGAITGGIEDTFDKGGSLADAAKSLGLTIAQTGPLTADGALYGQPGSPPPELAKVIKTAFAMEREGQPQLAETEPGKQFVLFEASQITPSAPAPLAEIKADVATAWRLDRGFAASGDAARKVLAAARKNGDVAAALASLGKPLPPAQTLSMGRDQLMQMQQQSQRPVPAPLALMFSMAQGTTKLLAAPGNQGWFVVTLKRIVPVAVPANDPMVASARRELGGVLGQEYAAALSRAMRTEVGARTNAAAFAAVKRQLGGGDSGTGQ